MQSFYFIFIIRNVIFLIHLGLYFFPRNIKGLRIVGQVIEVPFSLYYEDKEKPYLPLLCFSVIAMIY